MVKKKKSKRDGRLTLILLIGYFFILSFAVPKISFYDTETPKDKKFALKSRLISHHINKKYKQQSNTPASIPGDLTPFFFKKLPINSAGKELLMTVKGVGPKLAESIINNRARTGPFLNISDFLKIKGVGPKRAIYFETVFSYRMTDESPDK
jgi:competence ComEA-like helix-hairpin-helix protein